jgi:hypothetical protein
MNKEQIFKENFTIIDEANRCLDPVIYQKGWEYYQQGRVKWVKEFGPRIYSTVSDDKMYTVTLHVDNFSQSKCTCVKKQLCEHIAAVFFHCYNPRLVQSESFSKGSLKTGKKTPPQIPSQAPKPVSDPVMEGPVELWYEYLEFVYNRLRESKECSYQHYQGYYEGELYFLARLYDGFTGDVLAHSKNWPFFNKEIYRFHSYLFLMTQLEKRTKDDAKLSYLDSYQIEEIEETFSQALTSILSFKQRGKYRLFFQKAVEIVREHLFRKKTPLFDWQLIYRLICVTFLDNQDGREKETVCLEKLMQELEKTSQCYYHAALGLASLKMAGGRIEEAQAVLRNLKGQRIEDMLFYLEYLAGAKAWDNLLAWLLWLAPSVKEANLFVLEDICYYCVLAAKNSAAGEDFMKLVRSWLPRSFNFYAEYLLEAGLYREWAELNICYRCHTWESTNKSALRHLESREPAVLMPLYHQWAARLIGEKNRKAYQDAVKVLKKIRSLYNRQKMSGEWKTFISRLVLRHQRLRAFREELQKGKLI